MDIEAPSDLQLLYAPIEPELAKLSAFLEGEMLGNHISFDGRLGTDVDAIRRDMAFQVAVDGHGSCRHGCHDPGAFGRDQTMTL